MMKVTENSVSLEKDPLVVGNDELAESDAVNPEDDVPIHSGEKPHKCDQCGKAFRYKSRLIRHLVVHRSVVVKRSTRKYTHKCDQCDQAFTQKSNLDRHKLTHTGERPHKCHQCEKTFRYKGNLENHLLIHTGEKPYQCDQCDKSFSRRFTLNQHLRTHTGEKPYQCGVCGKKFRQGSCLWTHMQTHTGERINTGKKPHQCDQCGKRFSQKCRLKVHIWIHTGGPKPYKCDECGKAFNYKQSLKDHSRIHAAEIQWKCRQCGKCFATDTNLERHIGTHHSTIRHDEEKPHVCDTCFGAFESEELYKEHKAYCSDGKTVGALIEMENVSPKRENKITASIKTNHTEENPHICGECCGVFGSKDLYNRHMLTCNKGKPVEQLKAEGDKVETDGYKLYISGAEIEQFTNNEDKQYLCNMCQITFSSEDLWRNHSLNCSEKKVCL